MYNPLLMIDFYKATHAEQYPEGMTMIYSPGTPRMSRLKDVDEVVYFGGQAFCKMLIKAFDEHFFNRYESEVVREYKRVLDHTLGVGAYSVDKIVNLHRLGYLPIAFYAIPEGTSTKIGTPQSVFVNTHPDFAWLTNTLETMYSSYIWHIQVSAEVGRRYRRYAEYWVEKTCDEDYRVARLLNDFSMRGQHCPESAITASAAWLLSFLGTATVPAIMWLEENYNCDIETEEVGYGAISTEHSVMCSNYAVDGDEITHIKRLLTEIYPNHGFSMVSDSYDYENLVKNILPQCKTEIMNHNGWLGIRGDSGDPVEIVAGWEFIKIADEDEWEDFNDDRGGYLSEYFDYPKENVKAIISYKDAYYRVVCAPYWSEERGAWTDSDYDFIDHYDVNMTGPFNFEDMKVEEMGTVWWLYHHFGGTMNSLGYIQLPTYIKAVYGDSITPDRLNEIGRRLQVKGFAINNVSLGVGSFSFMCLENKDFYTNEVSYSPYTRDTFSYAIKATYGEDANGRPVFIQKEPKALSWKKSPRGCIIVNKNGEYTDGWTMYEAHGPNVGNMLELVMENGHIIRDMSLAEIRKNMWGENF